MENNEHENFSKNFVYSRWRVKKFSEKPLFSRRWKDKGKQNRSVSTRELAVHQRFSCDNCMFEHKKKISQMEMDNSTIISLKHVKLERDTINDYCSNNNEYFIHNEQKQNFVLKNEIKCKNKCFDIVDKWTARVVVEVPTGNNWHNIIAREVALLKVRYPFLTEQQLRGKALVKFGIPSLCGSVRTSGAGKVTGAIAKELSFKKGKKKRIPLAFKVLKNFLPCMKKYDKKSEIYLWDQDNHRIANLYNRKTTMEEMITKERLMKRENLIDKYWDNQIRRITVPNPHHKPNSSSNTNNSHNDLEKLSCSTLTPIKRRPLISCPKSLLSKFNECETRLTPNKKKIKSEDYPFENYTSSQLIDNISQEHSYNIIRKVTPNNKQLEKKIPSYLRMSPDSDELMMDYEDDKENEDKSFLHRSSTSSKPHTVKSRDTKIHGNIQSGALYNPISIQSGTQRLSKNKKKIEFEDYPFEHCTYSQLLNDKPQGFLNDTIPNLMPKIKPPEKKVPNFLRMSPDSDELMADSESDRENEEKLFLPQSSTFTKPHTVTSRDGKIHDNIQSGALYNPNSIQSGSQRLSKNKKKIEFEDYPFENCTYEQLLNDKPQGFLNDIIPNLMPKIKPPEKKVPNFLRMSPDSDELMADSESDRENEEKLFLPQSSTFTKPHTVTSMDRKNHDNIQSGIPKKKFSAKKLTFDVLPGKNNYQMNSTKSVMKDTPYKSQDFNKIHEKPKLFFEATDTNSNSPRFDLNGSDHDSINKNKIFSKFNLLDLKIINNYERLKNLPIPPTNPFSSYSPSRNSQSIKRRIIDPTDVASSPKKISKTSSAGHFHSTQSDDSNYQRAHQYYDSQTISSVNSSDSLQIIKEFQFPKISELKQANSCSLIISNGNCITEDEFNNKFKISQQYSEPSPAKFSSIKSAPFLLTSAQDNSWPNMWEKQITQNLNDKNENSNGSRTTCTLTPNSDEIYADLIEVEDTENDSTQISIDLLNRDNVSPSSSFINPYEVQSISYNCQKSPVKYRQSEKFMLSNTCSEYDHTLESLEKTIRAKSMTGNANNISTPKVTMQTIKNGIDNALKILESDSDE